MDKAARFQGERWGRETEAGSQEVSGVFVCCRPCAVMSTSPREIFNRDPTEGPSFYVVSPPTPLESDGRDAIYLLYFL